MIKSTIIRKPKICCKTVTCLICSWHGISPNSISDQRHRISLKYYFFSHIYMYRSQIKTLSKFQLRMPSLHEVAFKRCCMQAFTLFSSFQGDSLFCIHFSNVYAWFSPFQTIMLKIYCMQYLLLLPEIVFPDMLKISVNTECMVYSITSCVWCPSSLFERWRGHRGRLTLQWLFISGRG